MRGLAASRHAHPFSHRPARNGNPATDLTVTPAPTGGGGAAEPSATLPSPTRGSRKDERSRQTHRPAAASAPHELARYTKIIRRLQWKLPFLAQGYRLAVDRLGADPDAVSEAELMFKLDFFEYYMLIERALVHLLGVFGLDVPRGRVPAPGHAEGDNDNGNNVDDDDDNDKRRQKGLGASVWRDGRQHRYHANVLAALDREENPLHGPLGTGEVRAQLGRAKDLRNRWKTAGDDHDAEQQQQQRDPGNRDRSPAKGGATPERDWRSRKVAAPLDSYRLEHMLEVIFRGFDEAFGIAEEYVRRGSDWAEGDADMLGEDARAMDWTAIGDEEEQWEFMVDAMDWEAV